MTTISITIPETLKNFAEAEAKREGYSSTSEFMQSLIKAKQEDLLQGLLLDGLNSPKFPLEDRLVAKIKDHLEAAWKVDHA